MKGKIDKSGSLQIHRASRMRSQICPHSHFRGVKCGDWCPLFGEPFNPNSEFNTKLILCNTTLYFSEFVDER